MDATQRSAAARAVAIAASLVASVGVGPARATTYLVTETADDADLGDNGTCTLREAILAANRDVAVDGCAPGSPGADRIELGAGVYTLTIAGADEDGCDLGDLDVDQDLTLVGAGRDATVVDAAGLRDRVLHVLEQASVSVSDLTITGGSLTGPTPDAPDAAGGGIANEGTLLLERVRVSSNEALGRDGLRDDDGDGLPEGTEGGWARGGGIWNGVGAELSLVDVEIVGNRARGGRGAVHCCDGDCQSMCGAGSGGTARGGGIDSSGSLALDLVYLTSNSAEGGPCDAVGESGDALGGALHLEGGESDIRYAQMVQNEARGGQSSRSGAGRGGAVFASAGHARIEQSLLALNRATTPQSTFGGGVPWGGGMVVGASASAELRNSTLSGNLCHAVPSAFFGVSDALGGALVVVGELVLSSSTLVGNEVRLGEPGGASSGAARGGAIHSTGTVVATLDVLADNRVREMPAEPELEACSGDAISSYGGNVESPSFTCALDGPGDSGRVPPAELALGPVVPNGGPTATAALGAGSVALDRGAGLACPDVDQRGAGRVDAACDAGAFELECAARDLDGDGYSVGGGACGPVDCDDADPAVNPGAVEIPGNGIDDDCDPSTPRFGCEASIGDAEPPARPARSAGWGLVPLLLALIARRGTRVRGLRSS